MCTGGDGMSDGDLGNLFDKRLIVVSGKGGVGKTVISGALGLIASGLGKNVLLVKLDDQGRTGALFGGAALTDKVAPLRENISAVSLDPSTVVADWLANNTGTGKGQPTVAGLLTVAGLSEWRSL